MERDELIAADIGAKIIGRQRGIIATFEFTKTDVGWPGTNNEDGTREEGPRIILLLLFQVIETKNVGAVAFRQRFTRQKFLS